MGPRLVGGKTFYEKRWVPGDLTMPASSGSGFLLIAIELLCGFAMGSILMTILNNAINPVIVFVLIIATIVAILDFADYLPAFSVGYFTGYILEFFYPIDIFGDLKIAVFVLSLVGMGFVVAMKMRQTKDRSQAL
jgi:hypothetical protein